MIEITDKKQCCGCSACVQVCPTKSLSLVEDEMGFLYPSITKGTCVECGLCEKVCPVINKWETKAPIEIFACKNKNYEQRYKSSSGGVFVLLAEQIIKKNGVVFGAIFDTDWSVVHSYTENMGDLVSFQGSKYVQSRMENMFVLSKRLLEQGRPVLFSGTPCQISGLKHYLSNDYENLLTVEILCHGVPSPRIWRDYLDWIRRSEVNRSSQKEVPSIDYISFRDKHDGWNNYSFFLRFSANYLQNSSASQKIGKVVRENHEDNLFMKGFLNNLYVRPICFHCPAKGNRSKADISLGDFWSVNKYCAKFNDDKGTSLVYINSDKGLSAFTSINCDAIHLENNKVYNKAFFESTKEKYPANQFVAEYEKKGIAFVIELVKTMRKPFYKRFLIKTKIIIANIIRRY